jgi:hypothetical protein
MHPVGWEQGYAEGRGVGFRGRNLELILVQWFQSNRSLGIGLVGRQGDLSPFEGGQTKHPFKVGKGVCVGVGVRRVHNRRMGPVAV